MIMISLCLCLRLQLFPGRSHLSLVNGCIGIMSATASAATA